MAALKALPAREQIEFMRLKATLGMTDGNLGAHIVTLERAGYLEIEKSFVGKKPCTRVRLTKPGRRAFEQYVSFLRDIVDQE